jgi:hypothetical protein
MPEARKRISPTKRSLDRLRAAGYQTAVTEKWNPHAEIRQDLFGWCDLVAIRADKPGVLGVQTTTVSHQANRLSKLVAIPAVRTWLLAGNRVEVHGWKRRRGRWDVTRRVVTIEDLEAVA